MQKFSQTTELFFHTEQYQKKKKMRNQTQSVPCQGVTDYMQGPVYFPMTHQIPEESNRRGMLIVTMCIQQELHQA